MLPPKVSVSFCGLTWVYIVHALLGQECAFRVQGWRMVLVTLYGLGMYICLGWGQVISNSIPPIVHNHKMRILEDALASCSYHKR